MNLHGRRLSVIATFFLTLFPNAYALAGPPANMWAKGAGSTTGNEQGRGAVARAGSVLFVGWFTGNANFGGTALVSAGGNDIFISLLDANTGTNQFVTSIGAGVNDGANAAAMDASGAYYVAGFFGGTINFGLGVTLTSIGASTDAFVAKYAPSNQILWAKQFGGTGTEVARSVAVDGMGNVYVTGEFAGTAGNAGHNHISNGLNDIFLLKLDSGGNWSASSSFGSAGNDQGWDVLVDAGANVVLLGDFTNTVNFGGGNLVSAGNNDIVVAKYNSSLVHVWSQRYGSGNPDIAYSIAIDNSANELYLGANFIGSVNYGGGLLSSAGGYDVAIVKLSSVGAHIWSKRFGGMNTESVYSIALDASSNIFITGFMNGSVDFGGGALTAYGGDDVYIASYTATGTHRWSQSAGTASFDYANAIATDPSGNAYSTGQANGGISFGIPIVNNGADDVFMAKHSGNAVAPDITSIKDIPNDQGGKVKIRFDRSGLDQSPTPTTITSYEAYRKDKGGPSLATAPSSLSRPELLAYGWTFVGSAPAHAEASYGLDVATIGDSTIALGSYNSTFYVRAATATPATFYDSDPDSGYSKDNLAPAAPQNFVYTAGNLSWLESTARDFDYFTVYGSNTNSFGAATLVDYTISTGMNVNTSPYVYYFVTATDFSGNEGKPAIVNSLSGVGGTPASYVLSVSNYPNPFNPRTTVKYTVPSRGIVDIDVYDANGAHVATLFHGERNPGAYSIDWDGRTDGAAVAASGLYFARISHDGTTRTKKMVLLK